ncbi:FtsB family cell division protein [Alkalicoccus chagannorensis]|uniref:FtsB family cell division protein n=1 Tax=Alkalicoccus chagannorensis TaxID=427072 RepID=UPI00041491F1|nr:septum formation initiator family protein [Alkalicoccus chagannorensis]
MREDRLKEVRRLKSEYAERQKEKQEVEDRRRRGLKRRLSVLGSAMGIMVIILSAVLFQQQQAISQHETENLQREAQLEEMQADAEALEEKIDQLQDPDYIGEIARRDYFLSKPGETLFQLPRSEERDE